MGMVETSEPVSEVIKEPFETSGRKPNPIDIYVGSRVRYRRMIVGMSQEKLGEKMRLTFQQIQKYEKGTNRIGASRLWQLAMILNVPVGYFYEEILGSNADAGNANGFHEPEQEGYLLEFLNSREGLDLNRAFARIQNQKIRRSIIDHVKTLSGELHEADDEKTRPEKTLD
jgi:transcriptional regulator with XRE-family HTH domain